MAFGATFNVSALVGQRATAAATTAAEPGGELLAVVREHLLGHPEPLQGLGEGETQRPAGGPPDHGSDHAEPGVVVNAGDNLRLTTIS